MKPKIYTAYLAVQNKIPEGVRKIFVARYAPKSLDMRKENIKHIPALAPSWNLKEDFKANKMSYKEFCEAFETEIRLDDFSMNYIKSIAIFMIEYNTDIALICYEKDESDCHRSIVAKLIKEQLENNKTECELTIISNK